MRPIVYDVAVSADGFIADAQGDPSRLPHAGPHADDYRARLATYGTAIMGRATYEYGYGFGLAPGANPYPHMDTHVISASLVLPEGSAVAVHPPDGALTAIRALAAADGAPIYLCGGGTLAGWLLREGLIDRLRLKQAPVLIGAGVPLFAGVASVPAVRLDEARAYSSGVAYRDLAVLR